MRLWVLVFAAIVTVTPLAARQVALSSGADAAAGPPGQVTPQPAPEPGSGAPDVELPVSLDRIREGLARPDGGLQHLDLKPDFVVRIEERDHIISILSKLQVPPSSPFPGGGLYGYEQQQMAFPKNAYPLMQPYNAFSGGELLTLAIEGIAQRYLKQSLGKAVTSGLRERAERAAREEVATAIAEYCDAQPSRGQALHLCTEVLAR